MVDCKARLTEEIQDRFNYLVDFMNTPESKKKILETYRLRDFDQLYDEDKNMKNDLVYEKSKMTMYIENIGKKINSNFSNFIKKHIVGYVYSPDKDGNILCYDCEKCTHCYKCVDCVESEDTYFSIKTKSSDGCSFNIDCVDCCDIHISKNCESCGCWEDENGLILGRILLDSCKNCRLWCINLKNCVKCKNCINCIDCVKCRDCKDCKRCREMRELQGDEDCNMDFLDDMSDMERARYDWWFRR